MDSRVTVALPPANTPRHARQSANQNGEVGRAGPLCVNLGRGGGTARPALVARSTPESIEGGTVAEYR
jgi:hypothetical protein